MYIEYEDITSRIAEPPKWWLYGVPRYDEFRPYHLNVYAKEALLVHVRCQMCQQSFHVGLYDPTAFGASTFRTRLLTKRDLRPFGDPPWHHWPAGSHHESERCGGVSMNAEEVAVLQYWERNLGSPLHFGWQRVPELERSVEENYEVLKERHREAWRRIRHYRTRPRGLMGEWSYLPIPPELPEKLPQPYAEPSEGRGKFIDKPALNTRRRLAMLALSGRVTAEEFEQLESAHQREFGVYEQRPAGSPPDWAEPLTAEVRAIDQKVLENGIPGYASMTPEEREERYCHGLDRMLFELGREGRMDQEERCQLMPLLLHDRWS